MDGSIDQRSVARQPLQQRAKDRVEVVLQEAEALLQKKGLSAFSIPALAECLEYPRATIYKFFPSPNAVLNALATRHLSALETVLIAEVTRLSADKSWSDVVTRVVYVAAGYYQRNPVACMLLLSGPVTDSSYRALEFSITRLGGLTRTLLIDRGIKLPSGTPDIAALAVEFGTSSFRMSYFFHGKITPAYTKAAADVMLSFLSSRLNIPLD